MIRMQLTKIREAIHIFFPSKEEKLAYEQKKQAIFNSSINKAFDETIKIVTREIKKADHK